MITKQGHHVVRCIKAITEFEEGKEYGVQFQPMTGRQYKPGTQIVDGKKEWIDKEGKPENRIMLFSHNAFCARTKEVLDEHFESIN